MERVTRRHQLGAAALPAGTGRRRGVRLSSGADSFGADADLGRQHHVGKITSRPLGLGGQPDWVAVHSQVRGPAGGH